MRGIFATLALIGVMAWAQVPPTQEFDINNITGSVPLPQGAATEGTQVQVLTAVNSISGGISGTVTANQGSPPWAVSQSGSWTVIANAGTNLNTSSLALDSSVTGLQISQGSTTSGQNGTLTQAAVTSSAPSYTTGQTSPLSLNTAGALRVDNSASTQPISGTVTANQGGSWTTGRTWSLGSGSDSVASAQSGSWTVTANAGTNLNTSLLALDSSVTGLQVTQGSTTSSQMGSLMQAAVSTAAPSYTTAQTSPLSLTTSGALRVDSSASVQPVSQSGTWNLNDISGTISLPTGASTAANQSTIITDITSTQPRNITQFGGSNVVTGTGVSGSGIPRVTVSNDSVVLAAQSGSWTVQQGSAPWSQNITQFGGASLVTGTGASGAGIPRVTVASDSNVLATQSGSWTVQQGSAPWSVSQSGSWNVGINSGTNTIGSVKLTDGSSVISVPGQGSSTSGQSGFLVQGATTAAAPTYTTATTNPLSLTTTGSLRVDGSASTQPISGTVTANAGTNLNTSALALDTSVNGLLITQGSVTGTGHGPLVQGAVTASAPSYTNTQTDPLSLTTAGALRVDGSAVTQPANISQFGGNNVVTGTGASGSGIPRVTVASDSNILASQSGTWTVQQGGSPWSNNITQVGGSAVSLGQNTKANSLPVTLASDQSPIKDQVTTFTFNTTGQSINIDTSGIGTEQLYVSGTWSGHIFVNLSTDGVNFDPAPGLFQSFNPSTIDSNDVQVNGTWQISTIGFKTLQLISTVASPWVSGSANVTVIGSAGVAIQTAIDGEVGIQGDVRIHDSAMANIINGQQTMANSLPVVIASNQTAIPITGSITATNPSVSATGSAVPASATMVGGSDGVNLKALKVSSAGVVSVDGSAVTQPVSIATAPVLVAGSAIIGKVGIDQTTPGTTNGVQVNAALPAGTNVIGHVINDASSAVIGHVIADSGSTTAVTGNVASTIADGADVTLGAKADAKSSATDNTAITIMQVLKQISASVQAPPSQAVTNAGTFVTQSTLAAETTKVIGTVNVAGSQTIGLASGSQTIGALTANQSVNVAQINGVAPLMGNGGTGTGSQRVTIASDNTAFSVNAVESGTWTVQPGNTANTSPWLMTINDGTNSAKVQAASTAAAAADKALTVVQSPNGGNPCVNSAATLTSITGATSGTSAVQIIALSGTTKIYICSMSIIGVSGTTPTFSLVQGTGSNCVTGQTVLVQAWGTTANQLYQFANPVAVGVAGNELCYKDTGTTPIQNYQITYVQQ